MVNNTKKLLQSLLFGFAILFLTGCNQKHAMDMQSGPVPPPIVLPSYSMEIGSEPASEEEDDDNPPRGNRNSKTYLIIGSIAAAAVAVVMIEGWWYRFDHLKELSKIFLTPISPAPTPTISPSECIGNNVVRNKVYGLLTKTTSDYENEIKQLNKH